MRRDRLRLGSGNGRVTKEEHQDRQIPPLQLGVFARDDRRVTHNSVILVLVIVTALGFDFTNGFHDTANAMATSIATRVLRPKVAVALSGILNLIGAFLSVQVALTVTNSVVKIQNSNGTPKAALLSDGGSAL